MWCTHMDISHQTPKQRFCIVGIRDVRGVRVDPGQRPNDGNDGDLKKTT